jgi:acetolactate synthase-1/2/3 large subunit
MGYGVPAAVAAKIAEPERMVVSLAGRRLLPDERPGVRDGRAARRQHRDRGGRQRHVRHHPHAPGARVSDRVHGTELKNPDFAAYARAFGGHGETVEKTADFGRLRARARAGKPAIIHVKTDAEALTSRITLTQLREQSLARLKEKQH